MTVVSVKQRGGRRYVGVDSTVGNIAVESVYYPSHRIDALATALQIAAGDLLQFGDIALGRFGCGRLVASRARATGGTGPVPRRAC